MGPKPTADQKVKNCVQLFCRRKGRVKTNSINVQIVGSQAGDWWQVVLVEKGMQLIHVVRWHQCHRYTTSP